jgi:tetratricopeptide (TPR) repeat protein
MLGTVLRQMGRPEEALAQFQETLTHDPQSAEAWISIGQLRQRQRDADGAAAAFAEADRIRKIKADAQAALFAIKTGMQQLQAGDIAAAVVQLREAVRLAPDNAQAHYQLALALAKSGAQEDARRHMADARRLAPGMVPADAK